VRTHVRQMPDRGERETGFGIGALGLWSPAVHLLLQYLPLEPGEAASAQLVRVQDEDVSEGDVISLPEPLGPTRVLAVDTRGADLGTVHGDHGTLQELLNQGWSTSVPSGDQP